MSDNVLGVVNGIWIVSIDKGVYSWEHQICVSQAKADQAVATARETYRRVEVRKYVQDGVVKT
jgi:hypothetical protein